MVRRKIDIKKIEDKSKRHTTFTKRRQGLFKKANDLCTKCGAEAAIITFSLAGNAFAFGHPSVDSVLNRYHAQTNVNERVHEDDDDEDVVVEHEEGDVEKKQELELHELDQLKAAVEEMKRKVKGRVDEIMKFDENS